MKIRNETETPIDGSEDVDFFLCGLGYESRSRWLFQTEGVNARNRVALRFNYSESEAYSDNKSFFEKRGFEVFDSSNPKYERALLDRMLSDVKDKSRELSVVVDISVMSRLMLADVSLALSHLSRECAVRLRTAYVPATYRRPGEPETLNFVKPVKPEFAGWSARPDLPLAAILGLGYEEGLALGALEYIEPSKTWSFVPIGDDPRYLSDVLNANDVLPRHFDVTFLQYRVRQAVRTRARIDEIMRNVSGRLRLVVLPFGPKIFSWLAMLTVLADESGEVSVWRFSTHDQSAPVDRTAGGPPIWYGCTLTSE